MQNNEFKKEGGVSMIDPFEYGRLIEAFNRLKEDVKEGKLTIKQLLERVDDMESMLKENEKEHQRNDVEHARMFKEQEVVIGMAESLKKLEGGITIVTPAQAKKNGNNWFKILFMNPQYTLWVLVVFVVLIMIFMGYSINEISSVLDRLK